MTKPNESAKIILKPPSNIGLQELDKSLFEMTISIQALVINASDSTFFLKNLGKYAFRYPRMKRLVNHSKDADKRLLLLSDLISSSDLTEMPTEIRDICLSKCLSIQPYELKIGYDYWSTGFDLYFTRKNPWLIVLEQVFESILPKEVDFSASFETVGHLIHLNLRDELLPYKSIIGQVLLDKNSPKIRTVVTKTGNIENKFRTFPMEILAGEQNFETEVRENGCTFKFDFSKVYWNSRLHTEHSRLLALFKKDQIIADVFAGVGPFAVPAAKHHCKVYANDLNPESFACLLQNAKLNKISENNLETFNLDGREFIVSMMSKVKMDGLHIDHFIMNLPALALEFLDAFSSFVTDISPETLIHCYCFSRELEEYERDIVERAEKALNIKIKTVGIHHVRKVAPSKDMFCLSFKIVPSLEKESKKIKLTNSDSNSEK